MELFKKSGKFYKKGVVQLSLDEWDKEQFWITVPEPVSLNDWCLDQFDTLQRVLSIEENVIKCYSNDTPFSSNDLRKVLLSPEDIHPDSIALLHNEILDEVWIQTDEQGVLVKEWIHCRLIPLGDIPTFDQFFKDLEINLPQNWSDKTSLFVNDELAIMLLEFQTLCLDSEDYTEFHEKKTLWINKWIK